MCKTNQCEYQSENIQDFPFSYHVWVLGVQDKILTPGKLDVGERDDKISLPDDWELREDQIPPSSKQDQREGKE